MPDNTLELVIRGNTSDAEAKIKRVQQDITGLSQSLQNAGNKFDVKAITTKLDTLSAQFTKAGKTLGITISTPLTLASRQFINAATEIQSALNYIRIGTGATGETLQGLRDDFNAVMQDTPSSIGEISKAIADLNTMTGATGETLQDLSRHTLNATRMMGSDLGNTISSLGKLLNSWNLSATDGVSVLDKLFTASQNSGTGIEQLAAQLTQSGALFRELGVDMDEGLALLAQLSHEGIDIDTRSLSHAVSQLIQMGKIDGSQPFKEIIEYVKNAETEYESISRSIEIFGSLAGPRLADSIRAGKFEIDNMTTALHNASGNIMQTAQDTMTFSDRWQVFSNQLTVALEPLGAKILKLGEQYLPSVISAAQNLSVNLDEGMIKFAAFGAIIAPVTLALGGLAGSINAILALLSGPSGWIMLIGTAAAALFSFTGETNDSESALRDFNIRIQSMNTQALRGELLKLENELIGVQEEAANARAELDRLLTQQAQSSKVYDWFGNVSMTSNQIELEGNIDEQRIKLEQAEKAMKTIEEKRKSLEARIKALATTEPVTPNPDKTRRITLPRRTLSGNGTGGGNSGTSRVMNEISELDKFIQSVQDRMRYLDNSGLEFLSRITEMQSKLAPLSEDWKKLEDLRRNITEQDKQRTENSYMEKWQIYAWEFGQGLLSGTEYAEKLSAEIVTLESNTEKWRARFSELQNVNLTNVNKDLESLKHALAEGNINPDDYTSALNDIITKFAQFPHVVEAATEALKEFQNSQRAVAYDITADITESLKHAQDEFQRLTYTGINGMVEGFSRAVAYSEDFGDALTKLGQQIIYNVIQMLAWKAVASIFGITPNSQGNVFEYGNITPFASGGIVNKPTIFPMANGLGLMGEVGPEAVMPLTRDSAGRLGVYAQQVSSMPEIVINIENNTSTPIESRQTYMDYDREFNRAVVNVILRDQMTNGPITRNYMR